MSEEIPSVTEVQADVHQENESSEIGKSLVEEALHQIELTNPSNEATENTSTNANNTEENGYDEVRRQDASVANPEVSTDPHSRARKHISSDDDDDDDDLENLARTIEEPVDDATRRRHELEDKLDTLIKRPQNRRSRKFEEDLDQFLDEKILRLKDEMNLAAQLDIDTLNKRLETGDTKLIAMQKVRLLPQVVNALSKANLADTILDNNLLQSVRIWLEPLPDGSLPSFEIQKSLLGALNDLPIKSEHLKESGLGRVVIFYTKSKRVEPQLARLAEKLVAEWTRPIIGASDNYRDKRIRQLEFDSEKLRRKEALGSAKKKSKKIKPAETRGSTPQTLYEQAAARRGRAAAPAQTTTDYKYAPVSNVGSISTNARTTGVGSTLNNSEMYKRLTSKLTKNKRK